MGGLVYLDNAATTKLSVEVFEAMKPYFFEQYGNPAATSQFSVGAKVAVENSRQIIAAAINAQKSQICFTSGGSESNNWALRGVIKAAKVQSVHIITSKIEHHSVLNTCQDLAKAGVEVTYLDVDETGKIRIDDLIKAIRRDTLLISIMHANNEIGTIQDIEAIGQIASEHKILFHVDCVQSFGHIPLDVKAANIDLCSFSAHKLHGPKGVGALFVKDPRMIRPLITGGKQERNMRAGTVNVPGVIGFAMAVKQATSNMNENMKSITRLRDHFINRLVGECERVRLNGSLQSRLPNNINVWLEGINLETALVLLDGKNICCSGGSACASGSQEPSHVLMALANDPDRARQSLRFTLSGETTIEELDYAVEVLKGIITKIRSRT